MEEAVEIRVTVHFSQEDSSGGHLYTLRAKNNKEYVALLMRLAGYAYKEERIVVDTLILPEHVAQEKKALEWRMDMLNKIVYESLKEEKPHGLTTMEQEA